MYGREIKSLEMESMWFKSNVIDAWIIYITTYRNVMCIRLFYFMFRFLNQTAK